MARGDWSVAASCSFLLRARFQSVVEAFAGGPKHFLQSAFQDFSWRQLRQVLRDPDPAPFKPHLRKQCRAGLTRSIDLPEAIRSLPEEYNDQDLQAFFAACSKEEQTLFMTFLLLHE